VDRASLDEEVLRRAVEAGAELRRPATVQSIRLTSGGEQSVTLREGDRVEEVKARWVVDASGVAALLARQEGWLRSNEEHPTSAVWSRWRGVLDWDGMELAGRYPAWAEACHGIRATATNHFMGEGWWAWCIPLKGGDTSIGLVFDRRLVQWPDEGSLGERLKGFLARHPVAREIMADAECVEGDVHWRKHLPYASTTYAGDGFVIVGDAGAFLDPFYSPGLDWVSFTVFSASRLIAEERSGEAIGGRVADFNRDFTRSYARWFEALYRDKYEYFGEYDLMRLAFLLDLGLYYLGVAAQPFKRGMQALREPVFSTPPSTPVFQLMRTYNRRFAAMARLRRARGMAGRLNGGRRFMFGGYTFARSSITPVLGALAGWLWLEAGEGWRSWRDGPVAGRLT
jgi:flavin-dependent dehydrogenase